MEKDALDIGGQTTYSVGMELEKYDAVMAETLRPGDLVKLRDTVEEVIRLHDDGDGYVFVYVEDYPDEPYQIDWDEFVDLYMYT